MYSTYICTAELEMYGVGPVKCRKGKNRQSANMLRTEIKKEKKRITKYVLGQRANIIHIYIYVLMNKFCENN